MTRNSRATIVLKELKKFYPRIRIALNFRTRWELLVATILSAQCTDKRVNIITQDLFQKYPDVYAVAKAKSEDFEEAIRSAGFFRSKTKNILSTAKRIVREFNGEVPGDMATLLTLAGVARKTANVVLYNGFQKNEGIAVDTHVKRISQRLELTDHEDPNKIEQDLCALFPRKEWGDINHRMVQYGRDICDARKALCSKCVLAKVCPSAK